MFGLVVALELIFASGVALWVRWSTNAKIQGQTIWQVVVGVAGVVAISGLVLGIDVVAFVIVCFVVAFVPMAFEYFSRLHQEQKKAQKVLEESVNVDTSADR